MRQPLASGLQVFKNDDKRKGDEEGKEKMQPVQGLKSPNKSTVIILPMCVVRVPTWSATPLSYR